METIAELFARRFTPEERAAIDAGIAEIQELIVRRRERVLAELEALEASARSEIRAIEVRRETAISYADIKLLRAYDEEAARAIYERARRDLGADLDGGALADLLWDTFNWRLDYCRDVADRLRPSPSGCHNAAAAEVLP